MAMHVDDEEMNIIQKMGNKKKKQIRRAMMLLRCYCFGFRLNRFFGARR